MRSVQLRTLDELVAAVSLPAVMSTRVLSERGFDNQLLVGVLLDGREVLLRQKPHPSPAPALRAGFLTLHHVGAPRLHIGNDASAVLVDFVPRGDVGRAGQPRRVGDHEWRLVGLAYRRIHAVRFPAPLPGRFGPERLELPPQDPVELMHSRVDAALPGCAPSVRPWCRC